MSEPTPDSEWLAQLDELDSQFLAEDALREYELRKAVGLISEDDHRLQAAAAQQSQAAGVDDVWHSMEEVPLVSDDDEAAKLEAAKPELAHVDVSMEVQRVRKALHERRKTRHLQALTITESAAQESEQELDFQVCMAEPVAQTELAHTQFEAVIAAEKPAEVCHEIAEVAAEPNAERVLSYVQEHADRFSPSVRAMSDAETRLALAKEFEKLGQLDEAAQMCEEVLQSGSPEEQAKAQHYLRQLPGR
jgi:Tfp pilus assembly protein FimV